MGSLDSNPPPPASPLPDHGPTEPAQNVGASGEWVGYLEEADLRRIVSIALAADLVTRDKLDYLMRRIPQTFVKGLTDSDAPPLLRLKSQVGKMNGVRRLRTGEVPIELLLNALIEDTPDAAALEELEELLAKVRRGGSRAPPTSFDGVPAPDRTGSMAVSDLASIAIASGSTFQSAAKAIARVDQRPLVLRGFTSDELYAKVEAVQISMRNAVQGLEALRHLVPAQSIRPYSVRTEGSCILLMVEDTS